MTWGWLRRIGPWAWWIAVVALVLGVALLLVLMTISLLDLGGRGAEIANVAALPVAIVSLVLSAISAATGAVALRYQDRQNGDHRGSALNHRLVRRPRGLLAIAVLALVISLIALGVSIYPEPVPAVADACAPVQVGAGGADVLTLAPLLPSSGTLGAQGRPLATAAQMAADDVLAAGGVPGVDFRLEDPIDEGRPGTEDGCLAAAALLQRGVDVIVGPATSATSNRIYGQVAASGGLVISPSSTAPSLSTINDGDRYFRTATTDAIQGRVLGDLVVREGSRSVAVVARSDDYGNSLSEEAVTEMSGFGTDIIGSFDYPPTEPPDPNAFARVIDRFRDPNFRPDAILLIGFGELSSLLTQLSAIGINSRNTKIYGADGLVRETLPALFGSEEIAQLDGLRGTRPRLSEELMNRLQNPPQGIADFTYTAQAYDAVVVTALAAAKARSGDPARFSSAINDITRLGEKCRNYRDCLALLGPDSAGDIDYDGASGPLEFTGSGEPCSGEYSVVRYDAVGQLREYRRFWGTNLCTGEIDLTK